ncbi:MAG TPA: DUF1294 domain-containing protein [Clostridia bacterium]|nr:DUF1294 domain-containing protein [Clostridia bacterium]
MPANFASNRTAPARGGFPLGGAYVLVMGAVSYGCYALDKRRAREQVWRISESRLHLTELLGGWPGAFLAQRQMRHKVSKPGFHILFWLIVLAYQFAAFDSLQNWQLSRAVWDYLGQTAKRTEASPRVHLVTAPTWLGLSIGPSELSSEADVQRLLNVYDLRCLTAASLV